MAASKPVCRLLLLLAATPAHAAAIPDVAPWAKDFTASALANDPETMLAKLRDVAHPGFSVEALRAIFQKLDAIVGDKPGDYAEQFDERHIGTFLERINVAVHFPKSYLYYSITFSRDPQGWQMTQFDYNTNINDVLALKWPE